jgi:hypothetical protein
MDVLVEGFGHLCKQAGCAEVPFDFPLTEDDAASLLQQDLTVRII